MRIAFFHELPRGGARRSSNEIAKKLKKNHIVDLFLVDEKIDLKEKEYYTNTFFYKFIPKMWKGHDWKIRLYKDTIELFHLYNLHKKIAKDIEKRNYDLVFVQPSKYTQAPFILRFINIAKLYYCHDPHYRMLYESILDIPKNIGPVRYFYERANRFFRRIIDEKNIKSANYILANSKYTQKKIKESYGLESVVCYLGVDESVFNPKSVKKDFDILFIGSYEPVDGYSLLIDAIKLMTKKPKVREVLFEEEWIANDFILADLYRRSKITVCFAHNEPFGLVALESLACGTPVLAVKEGGYLESVIDGKTGFLINREPKKAAQKLNFLISNNSKLKLGKNAREEILNRWTWEKSAKRFENVFQKYLKRNYEN